MSPLSPQSVQASVLPGRSKRANPSVAGREIGPVVSSPLRRFASAMSAIFVSLEPSKHV